MSIHERFIRDAALATSELRKHKYVEHDDDICQKLWNIGNLVEFKKDNFLIKQGDTDQFIYLILSGSAQVIINGNTLKYHRKETDAVGEMTILNPSAPRLASIKAISDMSVLQLDYIDFKKILDEFPKMYASVLRDITTKFNQRNDYCKPVNEKPILFLISSVESLSVAEDILCNLEYVNVDVQLWSDKERFSAGSNTLSVLEEHVKKADFAIAIFNDDDEATYRKELKKIPRDNVVLELGMFLGRLGKERALFALPKDIDVKIPTDFNGITPLKFSRVGGSKIDTRILVREIKDKIETLGVMSNL
ncbi:TIR domain-containing protein [Acinetobacter baumannii]|uniref:TIR domain-containing protein n=1 Tax=Acinetobacter baumannii TaxID=470 RepID=UPI000450D839|nr:TIR domain-containing protein [Acinetobacter baumannii]EXR21369.1 cyclic nucleotide-binding domain protein [Acinetobacter baumannii 1295549]EXR93306.1 cyclic nucleotide-binding domain protein [Acinetobacter baumannii 277047]EXS39755.1 cyclic nucleotide-binding domain protein [Acinetobacter baumannii 426863]